MLPSGNDAAICIAEYFGDVVLQNDRTNSKKTNIQAFINEMNTLAEELQMKNTVY